MQTQDPAAIKGWKIKDFITLAIFNVVLLIIYAVVCMLDTLWASAGSYLFGQGIFALFSGPVYMVMANKISKRGVLFFSGVVWGLLFTAGGYYYYLIVLLFVGILCELVMWGKDTYQSTIRNGFGYGLFNIGVNLCGTIPLIFFGEQYRATLTKSYSPEQLDLVLYYYGTPAMVIITCAITLVGALAGCRIGNRLLKKHVKKARLV